MYQDFKLLKAIWLTLLALGGLTVVITGLAALAAPSDRTLASEHWFYLNAVTNFLSLIISFTLRLRMSSTLRPTSTPNEAVRLIYATELVTIIPLNVAAFVAVLAAYMGSEAINLLFTLTYFAAAFYFYPSNRRLESLVSEMVAPEADEGTRAGTAIKKGDSPIE